MSRLASAHGEKQITRTIGLGYINTMKYSGSNERKSTLLPYLNIFCNNWFIDSTDGLGYTFSLRNGWSYTQVLGYSLGRTDKETYWREGSSRLEDMGKIKIAATSSSTVGWSNGDGLLIEGNLTAPLTDSQGIKYRAGIKYRLWANDLDTLVLSSNANFGDARYNNTFYGISEIQSQLTGHKKFIAGSGLYGIDAGLAWTHVFNDHWWSFVEAEYTHLDNNVNKSSIIYRNNQTAFSAGLLYSF